MWTLTCGPWDVKGVRGETLLTKKTEMFRSEQKNNDKCERTEQIQAESTGGSQLEFVDIGVQTEASAETGGSTTCVCAAIF